MTFFSCKKASRYIVYIVHCLLRRTFIHGVHPAYEHMPLQGIPVCMPPELGFCLKSACSFQLSTSTPAPLSLFLQLIRMCHLTCLFRQLLPHNPHCQQCISTWSLLQEPGFRFPSYSVLVFTGYSSSPTSLISSAE